MNPANDERFMELAMKLVGSECTAEEKAELHRIIDQYPDRREELRSLCISAGISRELLPLINALEATEGKMTAGELAGFREHLGRVRQSAGNKTSTEPTGDKAESTREKRRNAADTSKVVDAESVEVGAAKPAPSTPPPLNKYLLVFTVALGIAVVAWLITLLFQSGTVSSMAEPSPQRMRWRFVIVQPMVSRDRKEVETLKKVLTKMFSGCSIDEMGKGSQELQDWEATRSKHMVQVQCVLDGGPIDRMRWLVDSFEVRGWRGEEIEFKRRFPVDQVDWTNSLEQIKGFVKAQK